MTSPYNDQMLAVVDARIRAASTVDHAVGTVNSRDTASTRAMVVFDGDNVAVPVKVLGGVDALAGDRVVLQRFGSEWVVLGSFTTGRTVRVLAASGSLSPVTSTIADVTGATVTFTTSRVNASYVVVAMFDFSKTATAIQFTGSVDVDGSAPNGSYQNAVFSDNANTISDRASVATCGSGTLAAVGSHTAKLRAVRTGAAGTGNCNAAVLTLTVIDR